MAGHPVYFKRLFVVLTDFDLNVARENQNKQAGQQKQNYRAIILIVYRATLFRGKAYIL